ncbi:MFS transporter [Microbacterium sp. zg.B48]|uniref:MFS transporter n=1 Tax=Microbacterium sp. zg.B48 TaxID=2969408 RepID=UPI00214BF5A8|nr:MFS transporter [Microbacterium sp. zg.B48]MCR2764299.1 MFS transporter [Microbacterium sp. zg.B48]
MSDGIGLRSERGPALLALLLATFLIGMSAWVIATAVPSIAADIGGFSSFPWLFSVYLLTMTVTVPVVSRLADIVGRKRLLVIGISVFVLGSVLCGLAWSMPSLIAFRVVQALGGGSIQSLALTVIGDLYDREDRARVQGHIAVTLAAASVIGPLVGGAFAMMDAWRVVFLINLPIGVLTLWLIHRNVHEHVERRAHRIDYAGAVLITAALSLLVLGALEGGRAWSWTSVTSVTIFAVGAALLVAFVFRERRAAEPIIPLELFQRRLVVVMAVLGLMMGGIMVGLSAFAPIYLQVAGGASPIWAGVAVAAMALGMPASSALAGRLSLRWGLRRTTVLGAMLTAAGVSGLVVFVDHPSVYTVAACAALVGIGFGFTTVPGLVALQESVPWNQRGMVTGLVTFFRSLGQVLGVAALGAVGTTILGDAARDRDPLVVQSAIGTVFLLMLVFALVHLLGSVVMPRAVGTPRAGGARVQPSRSAA